MNIRINFKKKEIKTRKIKYEDMLFTVKGYESRVRKIVKNPNSQGNYKYVIEDMLGTALDPTNIEAYSPLWKTVCFTASDIKVRLDVGSWIRLDKKHLS